MQNIQPSLLSVLLLPCLALGSSLCPLSLLALKCLFGLFRPLGSGFSKCLCVKAKCGLPNTKHDHAMYLLFLVSQLALPLAHGFLTIIFEITPAL
jgi:hypothetical protein